MKYLRIVTVGFYALLAISANAQLPPLLRQYFTTNAHVLSNGAGALTNNGTGTLGWLSLSNVSGGGDTLWTNVSPNIQPITLTNGFRVGPTPTNISRFYRYDGANDWAFIMTLHSQGFETRQQLSMAPEDGVGLVNAMADGSTLARLSLGDYPALYSRAQIKLDSDGVQIMDRSSGVGTYLFADAGKLDQRDGVTPQTNRIYGAWTNASNGFWLESGYDATFATHFLRSMYNGSALPKPLTLGVGTNADVVIGTNHTVTVPNGTLAVSGTFLRSDANRVFILGANSGTFPTVSSANDIYSFGSLAASGASYNNSDGIHNSGPEAGRNQTVADSEFIFAIGDQALKGSTVSGSFNIHMVGFESGEDALFMDSCDDIYAIGHRVFKGAIVTNSNYIFAWGKNVANGAVFSSRNNLFLLGDAPLPSLTSDEMAFRVADTGQFTFSNAPVKVSTLTASTLLSANSSKILTSIANATGALTNNGSGGLGYFELANLAPATGGAYIATNNGTGWNTTFVIQTNHSQIAFTNGSIIGSTATNTLTLTNSHLKFATDNLWDIGASGATRPRDAYFGGQVNGARGLFTSWMQAQIVYIGSSGTVALKSPSTGVLGLYNAAENDFDRIQFAGTTAAHPGVKRSAGHIAITDATGANSTNGVIFGNTVDTTASTGMTMNRQSGRVRLSSGNQTYLVTNNLVTTSSIITATINSDDTTATSVKAIPTAGLITLKALAATSADCDISFFIANPSQ